MLGWHENLESKEIPPQWMWHLPWEVEAWMDRIAAKRKERYGITDEPDEDEPGFRYDELAVDERNDLIPDWAR